MSEIDISQQSKRQARKLFEYLADEYATERERMPLYRLQLEFMLSALAKESGRILDIGCAAGGEIQNLRARNFSVVGIDLSTRMLDFARARFAADRKVLLCCADVEQLPFSSRSMDHVVCLGVFEYLPDYKGGLQEIHRVLRPGGTATFAIPSRVSLVNLGERLSNFTLGPLWRAAKRALGWKTSPEHLVPPHKRNLCVPWRYRALLRQEGFEPERSAYSAFLIYPLDRFTNLNIRVAKALGPLCSVPLLRCGASVYMVIARKQ
jgi:SAM-dependent methyltransferase